MAKKNSPIKQITAKLENSSRVALFSHVSPDGDTIGSMLALGLALEEMGKSVYYFNPDPVPGNLKFLPGAEKIKNNFPETLPDIFVFIDCAEMGRSVIISEQYMNGAMVINIDHHVSNTYYGSLNLVEPGTSATGEIIYKLLKKMSRPITGEIAINLYTGIITDTGRFSYSNTTPRSFRITAELVKTGIDLVFLNETLFEQKTLPQLRLLERALSNLEVLDEGRIALITLAKSDFIETGAEGSLSDGFVNYARNIDNVEVAALIKESVEDEIKVSFRSNKWLDVNEVARQFGGGGHIRASGCTVHFPLSEVKTQVIKALEEAVKLGRNR